MLPRTTAKRHLLVLCAILLPTLEAAGGETLNIIPPEEVRPGMKGYALTVFEGTEPEPFDVEVVGRLERAMPQQDIILVKCIDPKLREMKVASGMSGSPVYVREPGSASRGRLMGALAYSWSFQIEAIAGVTPITNMLGERHDLKREGLALAPAAARPSGPLEYIEAAADPLFALRAPRGASPGTALTPLATPVMISGLPRSCLAELRRQLAPLGLEPVQGGGGGGAGAGEGGRESLRPGDAIGVQLMRGDSSWTAVGTVTHVDGKKVLAFGHPFMGAGPWEAPVTRADVQFILKSSWSSFKLANAGPVVGSLVDDRLACIAAELGKSAGMVPVEVDVTGTGRRARTFRYEIVQHPFISGMLTFWALTDSINAAYPWRDDSTVTVRQRIELEGYRALEIETVESTKGTFSYSMTQPVSAALYNPFERSKLARVSFSIHVEPGNKSARIVSVRAEAPEVKPGAEVTLFVKIRRFGGEDTELPFTVRVPDEPRKGNFSISFQSGANVSPEIPTPRNLGEYLEAIRAHHTYSANELVAVHARQTRGLMAEGKLFPALPSSVMNVLAPAGSEGAAAVADKVRIPVETPWVLTGRAGISLVLRE